MRTAQHLVGRVTDFHKKQHLWIGEGPIPGVQLMRTHLIMEETAEALLALHNREEEKFVDGLGDILYVTAGSWVSVFGRIIGPVTIRRPEKAPRHHKLVHTFLDDVAMLNNRLWAARGRSWDEKVVRELILTSVDMCANAGYDPIDVFNAIADSNDTKWYREENGQRVKDKGPDFRHPILDPLLRGW